MSLLLHGSVLSPASLAAGSGALSPANPLANGLQVYYRLDEASGLRFDALAPGPGPAAKFTRANNERLTIADNADVSTGDVDFTIAIWVKLDALTDAQTCVGKALTTGNQREYRCTYRATPNNWQWIVFTDGGGANLSSAVTSEGPGLGRWRLLFLEHDAANDTLSIRMDLGVPTVTAYAGGVFDGTASFALGADTAASANSLDGAIASCGFWKRTLTASEQSELWNGGLGLRHAQLSTPMKVSLVAWWDLDEESGNRADAQGSNTLTDTNTVTQTTGQAGNSLRDGNTVTSAAGKIGTAAVFTAANSEQLQAPDAAAFDSSDSDWEWNGWVNLNTTAADMAILTKDTEGAGGREYALSYDNSSDVFRWEVFDGTNVIGTVDAADLGAPADDTWYFVRAWHSATGNEVGIEINRGTADTAATTGAASSGTTAAFRLGANGSGSPDYLNGMLDDWGRWNRILSSDEADERYAAGAGLSYPF